VPSASFKDNASCEGAQVPFSHIGLNNTALNLSRAEGLARDRSSG
jgi:hypothetical protein